MRGTGNFGLLHDDDGNCKALGTALSAAAFVTSYIPHAFRTLSFSTSSTAPITFNKESKPNHLKPLQDDQPWARVSYGIDTPALASLNTAF